MKYVRNMGIQDRIIRAIAGVAIAMVGFYYQSWWGLLALPPLITSSSGFCPIYCPFGISSRKED